MVDLETCLDALDGVVLVADAERAVRYASPSVERVLGYDDEALVGEGLLEYVHPDDRDAIEAAIDGAFDDSGEAEGAPGEAGPVRCLFRRADGSWADVETRGAVRRDPETGGAVLAFRDVTEHVELERELERYEVILESLDDAVYAIDEGGEIVYVNESYAALKGVDREALLGTQIYDWARGDAGEKIRRAREEMEDEDHDVGVVEFDFSTMDGGSIPVEMRFNTVTHPRDDLERTGVMRDVRERKARERALERKNERLEEFASILSHDLRNPLNVARGRVQTAIQSGSVEKLDSADEALSRIQDMIEDLLELAREGRTIEEAERVDLAGVVEDAWRTTETRSATLEIEDDARVAILADPDRLQSVVENLIRNAVEHGGSDVTVAVGSLEDGAGFYVEDDGAGIAPEDRERVLEPGVTTSGEGTGFGLGIVQQIAEAHGWEVAVVEGRDGGARLEFTGVEFPGT